MCPNIKGNRCLLEEKCSCHPQIIENDKGEYEWAEEPVYPYHQYINYKGEQ